MSIRYFVYWLSILLDYNTIELQNFDICSPLRLIRDVQYVTNIKTPYAINISYIVHRVFDRI